MTPVIINFLESKLPDRLAQQAEELEQKRIAFVSELANAVTEIASDKAEEALMILNISESIANLDGKNLRLKLAKYLSLNEKNFLKAKELSAYSRVNSKYEKAVSRHTNLIQRCDVCGTSDWFDASLTTEEGGFRFHLPPMPGKKITERHQYDGKYIYYLVTRLMLEYDENPETPKLDYMESPVAIFVHHIDKDNALMHTIDADNIDEKVAIDALSGYLVPDDNLLALWTMHFGVADKKSFCDLYIIEKRCLKNWLADNEKMLGI